MRLRFSDDVEAFRAEFVAWLGANRPDPDEMHRDPALSSGHVPAWAREWAQRLFDAGWLVPGWPPERGGRNATPAESLVYLEEFTRAAIPRTTNPQGLGIVAPTVFDHGNPKQIEEVALPIIQGRLAGCVGMSEPDAGSDLASLRTEAVLDGDRFVVNGQKLWTSGARHADVCLLFCRTDRSQPKHKGISVLLVDMHSEGVTPKPLSEIFRPERPDLHEVHLSDVVVPAENLVGTLNEGWALANASLAHERGMVWVDSVMRLEATLARLLGDAPHLTRHLGAAERAVANDHIVQSAIDATAARALGYRGFAKLARGAPAPEQALMKIFSGEARQRLAQLATELTGSDALVYDPDEPVELRHGDLTVGTWLEQYFHSFGNTISAGSSEIQRNIIAQRILGLPR